jgi:hypothetical protein
VPMQILGEVKYSPTRDILYLFPAVMQTAVEAAIEKKPWPDLAQWLKEHDITDEEIASGFSAYIAFITSAADSYGKPMTEAMQDSGWLGLRWQVRVAVMFYISYVLSGTIYKGAQDAVDDEHKIPTLANLIEAGKELDSYVRLPKWKRWWYRKNRSSLPIAKLRTK